MRLVGLKPRWAMDADIVVGGQIFHSENRAGMAVSFDCPCGCRGTDRETRLCVWFANPIDGGLPTDDGKLWNRTGDTFETLTLTPSIDASAFGHWHGFITAGEIR